ncbi:MAG TPA: vWA domain-containing protein [Dongiaceae bacterium]|nr:vWA domain-containing protein [Dongiaceae bacterium]
MKTSLKTVLLASSLLTGTAAAIGLHPLWSQNDANTAVVMQPIAPTLPIDTQNKTAPKIEVVFVLDTTGSMGGLIDAAKNNIWSIATSMASAKPAPQIRMGLVAYRDRGDEYVTKVLDLSPDMDSMYAALMDFRAEGGGDGPESVNQALHDAVNRVSWSEDKNSYKVIFLVGDAAPHMDYSNDVPYPDTLKIATNKGIVVNCIQAGGETDTRQVWQHIASLNQGRYFQVEQSGSAVAVATPFDDKIATLSRQLDETRVFYGDADTRRVLEKKTDAAKKVYAAAPAAVQAKRAEFNASAAGASNLFADSELVDDVASGRVKLESVDKTRLPEPLQKLGMEEQKRLIKDKAEQRKQLQAEIAQVSQQRQDYIKHELVKQKDVADSLDGKIHSAVREQAKEKGLVYESGPTL